ncbi:MAG: response regulator [Anaerolineae bacterium]|nr:response regulator [Anaerolineae bacterium]MDW8069586.1 response regulator [Anaerolineae bacterium]
MPQQILIVEDEPNTAEMLASYFQIQGYEVSVCGWGKEALNFVQHTLPDLIILDIRLPDVDGYEVCRQLRSHRRTAHIPILFLTEKRERIDRLAGLELGAVDYVTKPFDIQELRLRVRNILRRAQMQSVAHPVTELPFASLVEDHLHGLLGARGWVITALALDGLEGFADAYGFVARDDVLRAVALMVRHVADEEGGKETFVGQLDDSTFFIVTGPEPARRIRERLTARLQEALALFYPREDWDAIRQGTRTAIPRLSIRMGTLPASGSYSSVGKLREAIYSSLQPLM